MWLIRDERQTQPLQPRLITRYRFWLLHRGTSWGAARDISRDISISSYSKA
jgi:hypothetical protein